MLTDQQKFWAPKPCLCDTTNCAKCLGSNCTDDLCIVHTQGAKLARRAWIAGEYRKKASKSPHDAKMLELYEFETKRLAADFGFKPNKPTG